MPKHLLLILFPYTTLFRSPDWSVTDCDEPATETDPLCTATGMERSDSSTSNAVPSTATLAAPALTRSEEHTSELQSRLHIVCRPLLEKKNNLEFITVRKVN